MLLHPSRDSSQDVEKRNLVFEFLAAVMPFVRAEASPKMDVLGGCEQNFAQIAPGLSYLSTWQALTSTQELDKTRVR